MPAPDFVSQPSAELVGTRALHWGYFPAFSLLDCFALGIIALAGMTSRQGFSEAPTLLWIGLVLIFVPTAVRLLSTGASREERVALVVTLGIALYIVKILHSPLDFTFHDEFLHWQTANNLLRDGHLFTSNAILPVSASYPGMEIITTAFAQLSGLSVVESGAILLGIARIGMMLALFLLYERISGSARVAGLATALYATNSNFIFFDAQFSYESLALPVAVTILYAATLLDGRKPLALILQFLLIMPLILLLTITHHLTTYVLSGFLLVWTLATSLVKQRLSSWLPLAILTGLTLGSILVWSARVGSTTAGYLSPVFRNSINEIVAILSNEGPSRALFQNAAGVESPVWERFVGMAAVVFVMAGLFIGIIEIIRLILPSFSQRRIRPRITLPGGASPASLGFAAITLLYPLMQLFRLTTSGWEVANRSSEFLFWAMAYVLAIALLRVTRLPIPKTGLLTALAVWMGVVFVGGAIAGWPPSLRLPAPYMVSADSRSIEPQGIDAALWADEHLPPDSRVSADRINTLLMSVYGNQRMITHLADELYLASVFTTPHFGPTEVELLTEAQADYLVVDQRLSTELPLVGVYFEAGEPGGRQYTEPVPLEALNKFDTVIGISRVFDSGDIRIYDVRGILQHGTP